MRTHPSFLKIVGVGCLIGGAAFFLYQGYTTGIGIGGNSLLVFVISFSLNFVEAGILALVRARMAPTIEDVISSWGFKAPLEKLERILDLFLLGTVFFIYVIDAKFTYDGSLLFGLKKTVALLIAIGQLPMFELLMNMGFWLLEEAKINKKAIKFATANSQQ